MTIDQFNLGLVAASLLLILAVLAVKGAARVGLPTLLVYLAIGVGLGEAGLGVRFDDNQLTQVIGLGLLAVILAEGGLTTRWSVIRPVIGRSLLLSTVGVAASVAVTAGLAHVLLPIDLRTALLLGAIVSSTDAAAVFSVLRKLRVNRRLAATLESESGFNDAPVVILVALLVSDGWDEANPAVAAGQMGLQLGIGAIIGLVVAFAGAWLLRRAALPALGLYPLTTIAFALLAFGVAGVAGGSSFIAVYVAALFLGNARLPHEKDTKSFAEGLAWLSQIALFVLLGLLVSPDQLMRSLVPAVVVGLVLLLVARPLSVLITMTPFRMPWREQAFLSWAGLRGAVPIVLATIPISVGVPAAQEIFNIVFVLVVIFTLVQAPALPRLARFLRVDELEVTTRKLHGTQTTQVELVPCEGLPIAGRTVADLNLPPSVRLSRVIRDGDDVEPELTNPVRAQDRLILLVPDKAWRTFDRKLRELSGGSLPAEDL